MKEPHAADRLEDNIGNPMAPLMYAVSTLHCMTVSLAYGGAGIGTMFGEAPRPPTPPRRRLRRRRRSPRAGRSRRRDLREQKGHLDDRHHHSLTRCRHRHGTTRTASGFRTAAAAGIAFVVLDVIGTFLPGAPPASDASTAKIATYFHDHASGIKAQLLVGALGIIALVWWFGALWRMLSRRRSRAAAPRRRCRQWHSSSVWCSRSCRARSAPARRCTSASAETTRLLYSISLVTIAAAGLGIALFLFASCAVLYRSDAVPRWSNYAAWIAALAFLVGSFGTSPTPTP